MKVFARHRASENIWRAVQEARAGVITRTEVSSVREGMLRPARLPPAERAAMGERGRELCRKSFSWQAIARELVELYGELVGRPQQQGEGAT